MSSIDGDVQHQALRARNAAWQPALLLIFAQMASGLRDISQFAFFLIYLQEQLGLVPVTISSVVAGAQIAGTVAALLGGALTNRLGSKWVLVCGLILAGAGSLVFQVQSFWLVALLWAIGGGGAALVTVGGSSYLTRLSARGALGILAALYALSLTVGGAIGSPIAGILIAQYGFGTFGWAAIALTVVIVLVVAGWMANLHDYATEPGSSRLFGGSILPALRQPKVRLLIGIRGLPTLFYGMLMVLIPLLINELSGNKVTVAAYGTTTLIVASAAQLLAGRAADRWGAPPVAGRLCRTDRRWPGPVPWRGQRGGPVYLWGARHCRRLGALDAAVCLGCRWRSQGRASLDVWAAARRMEPLHDRRVGAGRLACPSVARPALPRAWPDQHRRVRPDDLLLPAQSRWGIASS